MVDLHLALYPLFLLDCFFEDLSEAESCPAFYFVGVEVEILQLAVQLLHALISIIQLATAECFDSVEPLP